MLDQVLYTILTTIISLLPSECVIIINVLLWFICFGLVYFVVTIQPFAALNLQNIVLGETGTSIVVGSRASENFQHVINLKMRGRGYRILKSNKNISKCISINFNLIYCTRITFHSILSRFVYFVLHWENLTSLQCISGKKTAKTSKQTNNKKKRKIKKEKIKLQKQSIVSELNQNSGDAGNIFVLPTFKWNLK